MHSIIKLLFEPIVIPGGGFFHQNRTWMCLPDLENLTISIYQFFAKFPTHQYTIFERKTPNFDQIGYFLQ